MAVRGTGQGEYWNVETMEGEHVSAHDGYLP
jgi:hypothetical protein